MSSEYVEENKKKKLRSSEATSSEYVEESKKKEATQ